MALLLTLLAAAEGRKYTARVVAGNPEVAPSCGSGCDTSMPPCLVETMAKPIAAAGAEGVDILVFPEAYFGDADLMWSCAPPADSDLLPPVGSQLCRHDKWWGRLGCLAQQHEVLVVVGLYDWGPCFVTPEPFIHRAFPCRGNLTIFNKALAVGADGRLLAVHHKHHLAHSLFAKDHISVKRGPLVVNPSPLGLLNDDVGAPWPVPDVTIFTSHFGVKFGILICHELNFASPLLSMMKEGVRDVIFPTQWGGFGGGFAATQSGFALAHGVNLLSANGLNGGSGIWPAQADVAPVQFPVRADTPTEFTPLWFGTMTLVSPAMVRLPLVAAPAPVYPMRSRTLLLDAANLKRTELVLDDVRCQLDPDSTEGKETSSGRFLLGASAGIGAVGLFEASCWLMSCEVLLSLETSALKPDLAVILQWPHTQEDLRKCRQSPEPLIFETAPRLSIEAHRSNFFLPLGQCNNGSVPLPRPRALLEGRWRGLELPTCPLTLAGLRSMAQSEFEEPSCPEGFCPSPSPCNDTSWEMNYMNWCELVPHTGPSPETEVNSLVV
ncbi:unnamed protein product [Effrenium voratum]|uniref:CN hydrolase domain-containing protein n=1 Tax=Effrenium voratum TaxID=2562239 RepID=A0AA36J779_9DINO|nr:unnamed protein product [Effrenium voratum]